MDFLKPTTENFSLQGKLIDSHNKKRNFDNMQKIKSLYQDSQLSQEKSKHQLLLETLKSKQISDIFHTRTDSDKEAVLETQRHFKIMQEILPSLTNKDRISSTDKYKIPIRLTDHSSERRIEGSSSIQKLNSSSLPHKHAMNQRYLNSSFEETIAYTPNKAQGHLHTQQSQMKAHSEHKNSVFSIREQFEDQGDEIEDEYYAVGSSFKGKFIQEEYQASKKAFSVKQNPGRRFSLENGNPSNKSARRASNASGQLNRLNAQSLMIQSLFQHTNKHETSHQKTVKSRGSTSEEEGEDLVQMSDTYNRIFEKSQKKEYSLYEIKMLHKQGYLDKEEGGGEQIKQSSSQKGNGFKKQELGVQSNIFAKNEQFSNKLGQHSIQQTLQKLPKNSLSIDIHKILKPIPNSKEDTISSNSSSVQTKTESSKETRIDFLNPISCIKKEHLLTITTPRKRILSEHQQSPQDISQQIQKIIGNSSRKLYATIFED